jgi:TonB family protein
MAGTALKAARPTIAGVQPPASGAAPATQALAEIVAITTQDDFLLELGAALGARASVHPVESLTLALERTSASRRACILAFDTRGMAGLRNCVGRAYARAPGAAIVLFAQAADEAGMRRAFQRSKVFAVLPIPMDLPTTALVFADALTEVLAENRRALEPSVAAPSIPVSSLTPRKDGWGVGAGVAAAILAFAWLIARDKQAAAPQASHPQLSAPTGQGSPLEAHRDVAPAIAATLPQENPGPAGATQAAAATARFASPTPGAADHRSLPEPHLKLIHYVAPGYPAAALSRGVTGSVVVAYTVDTQGVTRYVRVVSAEPAGIFSRAAVDAVKRWRYAPVMLDNAALAVPTRTTVRFTPP